MYSFESRISLARSSHDYVDEALPLQKRSQFLPTEEAFWDDDLHASAWEDGHIFKFSYSFYELLGLAQQRQPANEVWENFRRIISINA